MLFPPVVMTVAVSAIRSNSAAASFSSPRKTIDESLTARFPLCQ